MNDKYTYVWPTTKGQTPKNIAEGAGWCFNFTPNRRGICTRCPGFCRKATPEERAIGIMRRKVPHRKGAGEDI